jgi:putative ABC transport system permease protein
LIRDAIHEVDPDQPLQSLTTLEDFVAKTTADPRFRAQVLVVFAALAVLLSAIGIYGVLACAVAERRHEIGIRMALGATSRSITRMILGRSATLALFGVVIGAVGAVAITRVLENFLFEVKATDPLTFGFVALLIALVALGAGLLPARRASAVDPATALRCE